MKVVLESSFLANEVVGGLVDVEELVFLKKWASSVGGSHQEDSGGDLEFEDAHTESLSLLEVVVEELVFLKK